MKGKKLFSFIAVDDDTPIQKLTFSEQLRVLIQRLTNESKEQLKADDAETVYQLQLKANLLESYTRLRRRYDRVSIILLPSLSAQGSSLYWRMCFSQQVFPHTTRTRWMSRRSTMTSSTTFKSLWR